jgi:glutamate racemase
MITWKEEVFLQQAIGILDSGVGGLTVAREVMRQLPREGIIYFGDNERCPYGSRNLTEVKHFTRQIVEFLLKHPVKVIVVACNTATAAGLDEMRSEIEIPIIDVIQPGARAAIKATKTGRIGVIGTDGTIGSDSYTTALRQIHPDLFITSLACPDFVPLVENDHFNDEEYSLEIIRKRLKPLHPIDLDCLILGCTHYPILAPMISKVMGPDVTLISSDDETAREISAILSHKNIMANEFQTPLHQFYTSGDPTKFKRIAQKWLSQTIDVVHAKWDTNKYVPTINRA